ncbi:MAG: hypothetical protein CL582_04450 [Alteromonadaceae bacterium]|nr:hypothetical protein [Alteromonadaceae bacterium]|tara:strand:- start:14216 stop:14803 length:588 start_codon:yes stop_codon:yes gene_type:complete
MQQTRLTTENVSPKLLDKLAVEEAGLLGPYTRAEYEKLLTVDGGSWEFVFVPSKLDENFGQLKIRPKSTQSTRLLDKGRALKLKDLNLDKDYPLGTLINFIGATKRDPVGRIKKVQEFLLNNWEAFEDAFPEKPSDDEFHQWMMQFKAYRFKPFQVDGVRKLMPATVKAMRKPSAQKATTPRQQRNKRQFNKKQA